MVVILDRCVSWKKRGLSTVTSQGGATKLCEEERGSLRDVQRGTRDGKKQPQGERLIWGNNSPATQRQTAGLRGGLGLSPKRHLHPPSPLSAKLFGKSRRRPQRFTHEGPTRTQASNSALISNAVCRAGRTLLLPCTQIKIASGLRARVSLPCPLGAPGGDASERTDSTCNINTTNKEAPPKHP